MLISAAFTILSLRGHYPPLKIGDHSGRVGSSRYGLWAGKPACGCVRPKRESVPYGVLRIRRKEEEESNRPGKACQDGAALFRGTPFHEKGRGSARGLPYERLSGAFRSERGAADMSLLLGKETNEPLGPPEGPEFPAPDSFFFLMFLIPYRTLIV